ncbi:RuBisCO large subunit C-terminal-like domain-containing protein [Methanothrix soehngenii]|uniref:RuBisCO large subunit C-terminal-like domain-containing protein n=1 Tax=Methanothrix soehngenii TaxID=2223 RepID=UPI002FE26170
MVAGNLKKVRLQDVIFPQSIIRAHKGPRFGIEDARKILGVYDRPLVCTIVKPRAGSDPAGTPAMAEAAVRGGLDQVKDDETLTDQSFCPLIPRLEAVMFDVLTAGFSSLKTLSQNLNVPVHVHRTMHGASTRDKSHGQDGWRDGGERPMPRRSARGMG